MTTSPSRPGIERRRLWADATAQRDTDSLRILAIAAGIAWSVLFVVIGLRYELQTYGDGAMFSYSVAVQDVWAFHWHNISGRVTVFLLSLVPAEAYVALTRDPGGGIIVYGLLFFVMQLLGLIATYAADRSNGRIIFSYACFSTACLCPLVFGFPTEMWMAHAIFWPALAVSHFARRGLFGTALVFVLLAALVLTHEGAIVLAVTIVATALLRGTRDATFLRMVGALLAALLVWAAVKVMFPPGEYFSDVLVRAAEDFFDLSIFTGDLFLLLFGAVAGYGAAFLVLARLAPTRAHIYAAAIVVIMLSIYWLWLDDSLHAANRYYLRTILVIATPIFGTLAAAYALRADGKLAVPIPVLPHILEGLTNRVTVQAVAGAFILVTLVHAVETTKFVTAWTKYKAAVLALSMGAASDPTLGDAQFVSSDRIGADLSRLSWFSTTEYLSVILAKFAPARLVIDPATNYFWLSCRTATANFMADRAVPTESRRLVRIYACQHR